MKKKSRKPRRLLYRSRLTRHELLELIAQVGVVRVWEVLTGVDPESPIPTE